MRIKTKTNTPMNNGPEGIQPMRDPHAWFEERKSISVAVSRHGSLLEVAVRFCVAMLMVGTCLRCEAQSRAPSKQLTSFCGFKAGEKKQNIRVPKGNSIYPDSVRCRSPFRKFRDAQLRFSDDGRLVGVDAVMFIQGLKPSDGRAELDKCCAELTKYGIVFPDEWSEQGEGRLDKEGSGSGVSSIHIQGDLHASRYDERTGKEKKGALLTIHLSWGDIDVNAVPPMIGKYSTKNNLSRREFIEKRFGVKFGDVIPDSVKKSSSYNDNWLVTTKLTPSICGMNGLAFYCDRDGKLDSITLDRHIAARNIKDAEPAYSRLCNEVKNWLEIDSFETKDTSENFVAKKGAQRPMYSGRASSFEDGSVRVKVEMIIWSNESGTMPGGSKGASLSVKIGIPTGSRQERGSHVTHGNTTYVQKNNNGGKRAKEVEKLMKTITLPQCTFRPPDTIISVVAFMNKRSKELDPRNVPDNQRGINFVLEFPPEKTRAEISDMDLKNVSLWEALTVACRVAQPTYEFEVARSGVIIVKPKPLPSNR